MGVYGKVASWARAPGISCFDGSRSERMTFVGNFGFGELGVDPGTSVRLAFETVLTSHFGYFLSLCEKVIISCFVLGMD